MGKLDEILQVMAGHASLAWKPKPEGAFDPDEALKASSLANEKIKDLLRERMPKKPMGFGSMVMNPGEMKWYCKAFDEMLKVIEDL